jgi:RNA polymerase sigma-70 factor (ECF subfamily)
VLALKQGREQSYRQLYERYAPRLLRTLERVYRDRHVAHDAVQATFLIVFQKIGGFDERASLMTWLTRIALHEANHAVDSGRPRENVLPERHEPVGPERESIERQRARQLELLLRSLPTEKRVALLLFEVEGLSVQEIADITEEPRGTILARLSRTRAELRDALVAWEDAVPARMKQAGGQ